MNNPILKAERALISLGEIPIDVYRLPDSSYRLGQSLVLSAIDASPNWISRLHSKTPRILKALQDKGFTGYTLEISIDKTRSKTVAIPDAIIVWRWFDKQGNAKAEALIDACAIESIERRADAAFGVQRSEEERQQQMKARIDGKVIRRHLTEAIADYIKRHPELSVNDKKWLFKNCSDRTNKVVLGRIAKKAAEELKVERQNLRDFLSAEQLIQLSEIEDVTVRLIDKHDTHPLQAVLQAAERLLLENN
jgi:hypothetical protein